jgi:hypothetical protein
MEFLINIGILFVDFLFTTICFWLLTLLLPLIGITFAFSWGKAIIVWIIIKILKLVF